MKIFKWVIPLILIIFIIFCGVQYNNALHVVQDVYKNYDKLESLSEAVYFEFEVPDMVKANIDKDSTITVFGGELVIIECKDLLFRVAPKVDDWADVLGIEHPSNESYFYEIENNDIKQLRYRTGYDNKTSAYNWYTEDLMYGMIVDESILIDDILTEINIKERDLFQLNMDGSKVNKDSEIDFKSYASNDGKINILIPDVKTEITDIKSNKSLLINMGNFIILVVTNEIEEVYDEELYEYYEVGEYTLGILKANPFEVDTEAYNDFEIIKSNKDRIINTIVIK